MVKVHLGLDTVFGRWTRRLMLKLKSRSVTEVVSFELEAHIDAGVSVSSIERLSQLILQNRHRERNLSDAKLRGG